MSENLSRKISLFSFVFSIVIVAGHMIDVTTTEWLATRVMIREISNCVAIAMGYFFFVSGYLFYRNFSMEKLTAKWKSRAKSLLLPFIVWNLLAVIILVLRDGWPKDVEKWQLFFDINHLADGPLWYVVCLMAYAIFAPVLYWLAKNPVRFWIAWATLVVINVFFNLGQDYKLLYNLPLFLMGAGLACNYGKQVEAWTEGREGKPRSWVIAALLFLVLSGLLLLLFYDTGAEYHMYVHYLNRIVAPFLVFGCSRGCQTKKTRSIWKASFFIYCGHEILIQECMRHFLVKTFLLNYKWISYTIVGIGCFTIGVVGTLLIVYCGLRKYCPKVCGVLSGGRV